MFQELHLEAEEPLRAAAEQLHLPMEQLKQGLLRRKVVTGREAWLRILDALFACICTMEIYPY